VSCQQKKSVRQQIVIGAGFERLLQSAGTLFSSPANLLPFADARFAQWARASSRFVTYLAGMGPALPDPLEPYFMMFPKMGAKGGRKMDLIAAVVVCISIVWFANWITER
jgi:hypothetical protein